MKFLKQLLILLVVLSLLASCVNTPSNPTTDSTSGTSTTAQKPTTSTTSTSTTTKPKEEITLPEEDEGPTSDPYVDMSKAEFYDAYEPAKSYMEAYYRTKHNFMSGSIDEQDQAPTLAENRPTENGKYVRNTSALYSEDGNIYYIIDENGDIVNKIFKGGAYVVLEEVAAYLLAFGEIPPNYTSKKSGNPSTNPWGEYLRLNFSRFSGSTSKYPYEPELPNISGCGGDLQYYEVDIGTTGTDCDPSYPSVIYNNGSKITRGAARIVFTVYDKNGDAIIDVNEKYLFYTYNHYNDFQEYLNYEGGWGEMFGNITGGGTISSKYDYNPTPYVEVVRKAMWKGDRQYSASSDEYIVELAYIYFSKEINLTA